MTGVFETVPVKARSLLLHVIAWTVLALVVANIVLAQMNRGQAQENGRQQQFIQGTVGLDGLNKEIVKALVELAIKNQDGQVRALLASNGITYNVNAAATPAPPADKK